jgi:hypothetical protein
VGIYGLAPRDDTGARMAAWNMTNGQLGFFDLGPSGPTTTVVSTNAHPTLCTTFTDVNGDGLPDLVSGDSSASASDILFGDGGSRYGQRPWFARSGVYAALGDLDGDGLGDVVVPSGDRSIRVLFGGSGQLAYGPETALPLPVIGLAAGDLGLSRPAAAVVDQAGTLWRIGFAVDGTATPVQLGSVYLYYSHPSRVGVYDLGGTAAGGDVVVVTENGDRTSGGRYVGNVYYRNTGGVAQATTNLLWQEKWCESLPAVTPGTPPAELAALCVNADLANVHLYRSVVGQGASNAPWDAISVPSLAGTGLNAYVAAAGTLPGGQALFVSSPGAASGPQKVYAVAVGTGMSVTITPLAGATGPVTGAALGTVGMSGAGWLVVSAGGEVRTYLVSGPGSFTPVAVTAAPGVPAAILPLSTATTNDVLFATPDAFVPLVGNGSGGLQ